MSKINIDLDYKVLYYFEIVDHPSYKPPKYYLDVSSEELEVLKALKSAVEAYQELLKALYEKQSQRRKCLGESKNG